MPDFLELIDLRLLLVLSPVTTAIAWTMLINTFIPKNPWRL